MAKGGLWLASRLTSTMKTEIRNSLIWEPMSISFRLAQN